MRLFELTEAKLQPFSLEPVTPNQMDMMKDPEYMSKKKGMVGKIQWMSPEQYIRACKLGFKSIGEPGEVERGRSPELIQSYAHDMKKGDKFPMLELDYRGGFGQEGLHRAMAAQAAGVDKVPVFVTTESPEFTAKRDAERKAEMDKIKAKLSGWDKDRQSSVVDDILGAFDEGLNEALEVEFVCVNDSFPDATKQEQQDELFAALREVPGALVYRQDFGEHNSMAVIVRDEDAIPEIKRLAQENSIAIDMYNEVSERFIDSIYNNTLEGLVDWYASE